MRRSRASRACSATSGSFLYLLARRRPSTRPLASSLATFGRPIGMRTAAFRVVVRSGGRCPHRSDSTAPARRGRLCRDGRARRTVLAPCDSRHGRPDSPRAAAAYSCRHERRAARRRGAASERIHAPRGAPPPRDLPLHLRLRPLLRLGQPRAGGDDDAGPAPRGHRPGRGGRLHAWSTSRAASRMLAYPVVLAAARHARAIGLEVGVVTNCFWAESLDDALVWLAPFAELGLADLALSSYAYFTEHARGRDPPAQRRDRRPAARPAAGACSRSARRLRWPTSACACGEPGEIMYKGRAAEALAAASASPPARHAHLVSLRGLRRPRPLPRGLRRQPHALPGHQRRQPLASARSREILATYEPGLAAGRARDPRRRTLGARPRAPASSRRGRSTPTSVTSATSCAAACARRAATSTCSAPTRATASGRWWRRWPAAPATGRERRQP